jgi:hypothetical protein
VFWFVVYARAMNQMGAALWFARVGRLTPWLGRGVRVQRTRLDGCRPPAGVIGLSRSPKRGMPVGRTKGEEIIEPEGCRPLVQWGTDALALAGERCPSETSIPTSDYLSQELVPPPIPFLHPIYPTVL